MNNVTLCGRLTKKPELNYTQATNKAVAKFTLAIDRPRNAGQEDPGADFIRIITWGKIAENCANYLDKGRQVCLSGRIQTGSYTNKDGQTVYTTDVVADKVEFLGSRNEGNAPVNNVPAQQNAAQQNMAQQEPYIPDSFEAAEDDIPF